jgi:Ca2+-binding EF-hand superfamily protein
LAKTEKLLNQFDTDGNAELEIDEFIELHKSRP